MLEVLGDSIREQLPATEELSLSPPLPSPPPSLSAALQLGSVGTLRCRQRCASFAAADEPHASSSAEVKPRYATGPDEKQPAGFVSPIRGEQENRAHRNESLNNSSPTMNLDNRDDRVVTVWMAAGTKLAFSDDQGPS
ncbi:hypothetical protein EYF80_017905 [Liparis tanakae]|uniref:Uncharacterized protein n=1 Tax=Liparis tanakae TaxID=230148 RepID=A0A4Z2I1T9_9TELE|nr:hypothetical protein EYF80_017905 [Liparis tanakae]